MKLTFVRSAMVAGAFLVASVAHAATIEQLFLADLTGNFAAQVDVDNAGNVTCSAVAGFTDACGGLTLPSSPITPHGNLTVTGTVGQFRVSIDADGGVTNTFPTLQTMTQANVRNVGGAGDFETEFTDSQYCIDFPSCFGSTFNLKVGQTPDTPILASHTDFNAFVSSVNSIPATLAINPTITLTGNTTNGFSGQNFANPNGPSGSLSASTLTHFTGAAKVQTTFTISTIPEPSTLALLGLGAGFLGLGLRRRKV